MLLILTLLSAPVTAIHGPASANVQGPWRLNLAPALAHLPEYQESLSLLLTSPSYWPQCFLYLFLLHELYFQVSYDKEKKF